VKLEDVRVAKLPAGKDPDEVLREDPAAWDSAIGKALPLVEYLIDHHAGRFDLKSSTGRIGFVDAVMPAIRDIADPMRRDEALQQVRHVSGVEERTLRQVLDRRIAAAVGPGKPVGGANAAASRITAEAVLASPDALPVADILRAVTPVEAELLRLLPARPRPAAPGRRRSSVPTSCLRRSLASCSGRSCCSASRTTRGIHPPFARRSAAARPRR
jgi:DNA primase